MAHSIERQPVPMLFQPDKNRTRDLVAESWFRDELTTSPVAATIRFRSTITSADRPQTKRRSFQRQKLVPEMVDGRRSLWLPHSLRSWTPISRRSPPKPVARAMPTDVF